MYIQMIVTNSENPKYHSKFLSNLPAKVSILSKSIIKLKEATATTMTLNAIPIGLLEKIAGIEIWKKLNIN